MTFTLNMAWLGVSVAYIGTGVYLHLAYGPRLPANVPLTFVFLGGAVFAALNRTTIANTDFGLLVTELVILTLFIAAWVAGVLAVRAYVQFIESNTVDWPCE